MTLEELKSKYNVIGRGSSSLVFEVSPTRVIKYSNSISNFKFYEYSKNNPSKHLPKVFEAKLYDNHYIIEASKLNNIEINLRFDIMDLFVSRPHSNKIKLDDSYTKQIEEMKDILLELRRESFPNREFILDANPSNIMMDDNNTLILNDIFV